MEAQNAIVLNDLSGYLGNDPIDTPEGQTAHHEFSLPQADGGKDAWLFLAAGFVIEALVVSNNRDLIIPLPSVRYACTLFITTP